MRDGSTFLKKPSRVTWPLFGADGALCLCGRYMVLCKHKLPLTNVSCVAVVAVEEGRCAAGKDTEAPTERVSLDERAEVKRRLERRVGESRRDAT